MANKKILEEYSVRIYEIDAYFYDHYIKKRVDDNDQEYISFRIDIYFTEYSLTVEIYEKGHTDRDLEFEKKKRQEALEKKLNCTFIRINTSRENYDADYEASRIQTFISNFNKNKIKKLEDKIKNLSVKNNVNNK